MKKIFIITSLLLINSFVFCQEPEFYREISISTGLNRTGLNKTNRFKLGEYLVKEPTFFANFNDLNYVSVNYIKRKNNGNGFGVQLEYKNAKNHSYDREISNRFDQASFSSFGFFFLFSRDLHKIKKIRFPLSIYAGANYINLKTGRDIYILNVNSTSSSGEVLTHVYGVEHVLSQKIITPTIGSSIGCYFQLNNIISLKSSLGIESSRIFSSVAPEKYSINYKIEFGVSFSLI